MTQGNNRIVDEGVSSVTNYRTSILPNHIDVEQSTIIKYDTINSPVPNFGIQAGKCLLLFGITAKQTLNDQELYGYIDYPLLDTIRVYEVDSTYLSDMDAGIPSSVINPLFESGESVAFNKRNTGVPGYIFPLGIKDGQRKSFLMEVSSGEQIVVPLVVGTRSVLEAKLATRELFYAIYLGIIVVMIVYNLFIYLSVRDVVYIHYVLYILTVGLTQLVISGFANKYFWPNSSNIAILASAIVPIASGIATIGFTRSFIQIKKYAPFIDKLLIFYFVSYLVSALCAISGNHFWAQIIINFNAASALILLPAAIKAIRAKYRPARFFIVAWTIFLIGVTLYALRNFGILPFNNVTNYALPIGSALETVLLSFALADRINTFKKEKEESQRQAMLVMEENSRLISEQNVKLELMVHERTVDLERTNNELNHTVQDLKMTQKQLVEAEKLASLGQMTAGIAHEINNPINFVQSNILPLKRDVDDILGLLESVSGLEPGEGSADKINDIKKQYQTLDMDYVKVEIGQLMEGIEEGARRTAEIVKGLKVFSRVDRDTHVNGNINDCINSTLVVMKSTIKGQVTIVKNLQEKMPGFHCFPGKLNQVLMNIITNAIQSTEGPGKEPSDRVIEINSRFDDNNIIFSVKDNGTGIDDSVRPKIFDPFYTTKGVGEGTGLGLSIVLGIVNEHQGRIDVESEPGKGSIFTITLPRHVNSISQAAA
ncbi:MAG: GHKL domain-containing protein [Crocinitomicaceae bacterium]|nr:GHKL domain-containing protein [Crocinitomicaceae bacterium]